MRSPKLSGDNTEALERMLKSLCVVCILFR